MNTAQKKDSSGNVAVFESAGTTDSSYCMGVTQSTWMRYSKNSRRCDSCTECTECDRCTFCVRCHGCTSCENATDCLDCTGCVGCVGCIGCTPQQNCGCQTSKVSKATPEGEGADQPLTLNKGPSDDQVVRRRPVPTLPSRHEADN